MIRFITLLLLFSTFLLGVVTYLRYDIHQLKLSLYEDTRIDVYLKDMRLSCPMNNGSVQLVNCFPYQAELECDEDGELIQNACTWIAR